MAEKLAVWLHGIAVASIDERRGRLRLSYNPDAIEEFPPGLPLLSLSLPIRPEPHVHGTVRPFLDGLLPEGDARRAIARRLDVPSEDTFGLIRALGRDCAGALVIQPADEPMPPEPTTLTAQPLDEAEIDELVGNLPGVPLGAGDRVRISLAGVQEKLLLTRMPGGGWGRPFDGTPSTHILKPAVDRFPNIVDNEAFCMRLARNLELPVAAVETITAGRRRLLVVERYDRIVHPDGRVNRVHQEDLCQALGILPDRKYEEDGGPSLRRAAGILQAFAPSKALDVLLRAAALTVGIGNGDAHGKNFSLLHDRSGSLLPAPLYDLVCTVVYGDRRLGMYIDTVQRSDRATADRLVNEAVGWGMSRHRAAELVDDVLDRLPGAAAAARDQTEALSEEVFATVAAQIAQLRRPRH